MTSSFDDDEEEEEEKVEDDVLFILFLYVLLVISFLWVVCEIIKCGFWIFLFRFDFVLFWYGWEGGGMNVTEGSNL